MAWINKTKEKSRLQRKELYKMELWTQMHRSINSYQLGYWGKRKDRIPRYGRTLWDHPVSWCDFSGRGDMLGEILETSVSLKEKKNPLEGRNSGVWLAWHVVLMQRTDPWHYWYKNNEPLDFVLPAFTLALASIRVACVRSSVNDSLVY